MPQSPTTLVACPCVHPLARPLPEQLEAVFATAQVFELTGCHVANRKLRIRRASRTNGHTASNANARQGGTGLVNGLAFFRIRPPLTRSPIQILTASHPRSLRSLVKSNKVLSCSRRSRSSHKQTHTCCRQGSSIARRVSRAKAGAEPATRTQRKQRPAAGSYAGCGLI